MSASESKMQFTARKLALFDRAAVDRRLIAFEFRLLYHLASSYLKRPTSTAFPGLTRLSDEFRTSRNRVHQGLKKLAERWTQKTHGWLLSGEKGRPAGGTSEARRRPTGGTSEMRISLTKKTERLFPAIDRAPH